MHLSLREISFKTNVHMKNMMRFVAEFLNFKIQIESSNLALPSLIWTCGNVLKYIQCENGQCENRTLPTDGNT